MNCSAIVPLLPEYIRRRLPTAEMAAVRAHLSACPACAAAYEDELVFGALMHGTDEAAPPHMLARVMADVRAEPQQMPAFRLRPLDLLLAVAIVAIVGGFGIGAFSLWAISPILTTMLDLRALFGGDETAATLVLAALWGLVGLAISVPVAAVVHAALDGTRRATADLQQ